MSLDLFPNTLPLITRLAESSTQDDTGENLDSLFMEMHTWYCRESQGVPFDTVEDLHAWFDVLTEDHHVIFYRNRQIFEVLFRVANDLIGFVSLPGSGDRILTNSITVFNMMSSTIWYPVGVSRYDASVWFDRFAAFEPGIDLFETAAAVLRVCGSAESPESLLFKRKTTA